MMKEIKLAHPPAGPNVFRRMLDELPAGQPGEIFRVMDKRGELFGYAFFNPNSSIVFRIFSREINGEFEIKSFLREKILSAANLRKSLGLPSSSTDVYRLIHDYGDGLPGLTVDVYGNNVVAEFYSIGFYALRNELKEAILEVFPGSNVFFRASDYTMKMEGFDLPAEPGKKVKVRENGIIFEVDLAGGYKTGFFCDQRDNRAFLGSLSDGKTVIDICSYTGGFSIYAKKGGAKEVTAVDLDPEAVEGLKRNANLNSARVSPVCSDAFIYMRQMMELKRQYDIVILDPSKVITSRDNKEEGIVKYKDMNKLALHLVKPGGIFLTCSCSGLLSWDEFSEILRYASSVARRRTQIFRKSGAGGDHPFMVNYREGEYLKALWSRVF
ncbi:MAG: class I SAM-dependent rRNA methyltransferase [Elusimicrobiota bacterium]